MSTQRLLLEDFAEAGPVRTPLVAVAPSIDHAAMEADAERARVAAYESGYKTGWDDAVRAAEEDRRAIGEELARNLRDVNFTFFEARDELLVGLRSFMRELLDRLFPALLPEASASAIVEVIQSLGEDVGSTEIAVAVSPDDAETVRSLLPLPDGVEVSVLEEPALAPGQARLRAAEREFSIDADRVVAMLRDAVAAAHDDEERSAHG